MRPAPWRVNGGCESGWGTARSADVGDASNRAVAREASARAGRSGPCFPCPVDAQAHPSRINVRNLQTANLAGPKTRGIGRHQYGTVPDVGGDRKQPHQLVVVEDLGQLRRRLGPRDIEVRVRPTERDAVQETDPLARTVAALPGQSTLLVKVKQVVLNLLCGDLPRGCACSGTRARTE